MTRRRAAEPEVYRITSARAPHSDDLDQRIRRYLISMGIRTACVLLVFVVHHPVRWVFAGAAVVLPYIAVLFANATDRRTRVPDSSPIDHRGLGARGRSGSGPDAPRGTVPPSRSAGDSEVLTGVIVNPPKPAEQ
ncbi:MAG TPA: DUF3099 domain-containing protein [Kineosporiaceae bacterium]|nr:DUF3099 domain-containing protein [Kineosporiaceae bacterium]